MKNDDKNQIVIFLLGEHGAGKTWIAKQLVNKYGFTAKLSIAETIRSIATDPGIFNIPAKYFDGDIKDLPMEYELKVKEAHVRRLISWLLERIPPMLIQQMDIRRMRAVSNYALPVLKTPREVLQYIGFGVINKISADLVPLLAYNPIIGCPGSYVFDDLRMESQFVLAQQKFQLVYAIGVHGAKKTTKVDDSQYSVEESGWKTIETFANIKNDKNPEKIHEVLMSVIKKINDDIDQRITNGLVRALPRTVGAEIKDFAESKGPLGRALGQQAMTNTMEVGKAVFSKVRDVTSDILTDGERIKFYHDAGTVDRSGLYRKS